VWYTYHSEKYEFVNGKDDIPFLLWKIKHVPNHQPDWVTNDDIASYSYSYHLIGIDALYSFMGIYWE
jgi:hypothetical protein